MFPGFNVANVFREKIQASDLFISHSEPSEWTDFIRCSRDLTGKVPCGQNPKDHLKVIRDGAQCLKLSQFAANIRPRESPGLMFVRPELYPLFSVVSLESLQLQFLSASSTSSSGLNIFEVVSADGRT